jgi:hypothetical protein
MVVIALAWTSAIAALPADADQAVAKVLARANDRVAAGESPDEVEAWLGTQLKPFKATPRPPDWDVYGAARWRSLEGNPGPVLGTPAPTTR